MQRRSSLLELSSARPISAKDIGGRQRAGKVNFAPDEWARVVASPMVITNGDHSRRSGWPVGHVEGVDVERLVLAGSEKDASANPLAKAVADDITDATIRSAARERVQAQFKGARVEEIKTRAIEKLRAVASLLDAKAPDEAPRQPPEERHAGANRCCRQQQVAEACRIRISFQLIDVSD